MPVGDIQPCLLLVQVLAQMKSLRSICLADPQELWDPPRVHYHPQIANEFMESLQRLPRLSEVVGTFHGTTFSETNAVNDRIEFFVRLNNHGRYLIDDCSAPFSLLPHVLVALSGDPSMIFYFVRNIHNLSSRRRLGIKRKSQKRRRKKRLNMTSSL